MIRKCKGFGPGVRRNCLLALGEATSLCPLTLQDLEFVLEMLVTLGFGSQTPLLRTIFHGLGTKAQGYKP